MDLVKNIRNSGDFSMKKLWIIIFASCSIIGCILKFDVNSVKTKMEKQISISSYPQGKTFKNCNKITDKPKP